jgi:putative endonuclease
MVDKKPPQKTRQQAEAKGRRAELIAAIWLMLKGYRILARRVKTKMGEIDLIARKGKILAFIEVKARSGFNESLSPQSAGRIARAAALWTSSRPWARSLFMRFDIVAIVPGHAPRHYANAFQPEPQRL